MVTEIPQRSLLEPVLWAVKCRGVLARRCITCGPRPPGLVSRRMAPGKLKGRRVLCTSWSTMVASFRLLGGATLRVSGAAVWSVGGGQQ